MNVVVKQLSVAQFFSFVKYFFSGMFRLQETTFELIFKFYVKRGGIELLFIFFIFGYDRFLTKCI